MLNNAMLSIITDFVSLVAIDVIVLGKALSKWFTLDSWLTNVPHAEVQITIQQTCAIWMVKVEDEQKLEGSYTFLDV